MPVDKKNFFLESKPEKLPFTSRTMPVKTTYPKRDTQAHAKYIQEKLKLAYKENNTTAVRYKEGIYLEFSALANHPLLTKSLENQREGIRIANIRETKTQNNETVTHATVYIPAGKEQYFLKKAKAYETELTEKGKKPKNNDLISSIENIQLAMLSAFWIGEKDDMPRRTTVWCEIWLYFKGDVSSAKATVISNFVSICEEYEIKVDDREIIFPERIVKLVYANEDQLKQIIGDCSYIAEMRRAQEVSSLFTEELTTIEKQEWIDDLITRTKFQDGNVSICLLDTGLTATHQLLESSVQRDGVHAIDPSWKDTDHAGHGTEMAGIAVYNDLQKVLELRQNINVSHKIESVKILPPPSKDNNHPELYGEITKNAVAISEIYNPQLTRIVCMAITAPKYNTHDGSPTSWSAAIDSITSGADENGEKRLFFVSGGNVHPSEHEDNMYPDANIIHGIESPGQSWNAITVGAYSKNIAINDSSYSDFSAVADVNELSPYSSTSQIWNKKWPIKPEILLDGGNIATNNEGDFTSCDDLSILTTHYKPLMSPFSTIHGTSSATAQASWMAAQIATEYPEAWPETIRALMVHSANWTDKMKKQFCPNDKTKSERNKLIRACGYGVPNLEKAIQCMNNNVNLVIQGDLQPFAFKKGTETSMNEMHYHTLPWPKELLQGLGEVSVKLKITLSYFIEPGPGEVGWKDKYRYPSCGLRFDVINSDENIVDFRKRINVAMRGDDNKDSGDGSSGSDRWYLGSNNRDIGSIHSDFCELSAVDLCDANHIAVYPVIGWWRQRKHLGKVESSIRYSLVVSLETPEITVDLYTPILTQIQNTIEIAL